MALEKTFKELSDVNRRKILSLLRKKTMNAGEIAKHFENDFGNAFLSSFSS